MVEPSHKLPSFLLQYPKSGAELIGFIRQFGIRSNFKNPKPGELSDFYNDYQKSLEENSLENNNLTLGEYADFFISQFELFFLLRKVVKNRVASQIYSKLKTVNLQPDADLILENVDLEIQNLEKLAESPKFKKLDLTQNVVDYLFEKCQSHGDLSKNSAVFDFA